MINNMGMMLHYGEGLIRPGVLVDNRPSHPNQLNAEDLVPGTVIKRHYLKGSSEDYTVIEYPANGQVSLRRAKCMCDLTHWPKCICQELRQCHLSDMGMVAYQPSNKWNPSNYCTLVEKSV